MATTPIAPPETDIETGRAITAAVVRTPGGPFEITRATLAPPAPNEVLVRIVATGLCHTDLLVRDQEIPVPLPLVLGHEGAGVVEEVGANVSRLKRGDRVVLSFTSCGQCQRCDRGQPSYCDSMMALNFAGGRMDGSISCRDEHGRVHDHFFGQSSFATHALANERNCIRLESDDPLEIAGPLGCGVQTGAGAVLNALAVEAGSSIAIFGGGAVGLSAVMAAHVAGATMIIATDIVQSRLDLALDLGATHAIDASQGDVVGRIREITGGGVQYALETTGHAAVQRDAVDALGVRGVLGLLGAGHPGSEMAFEMVPFLLSGKTIRAILIGDAQPHIFIPQLLALYRQGSFPFDRLIKTYPLSAIEQAVADSLGGRTVKAVITMD